MSFPYKHILLIGATSGIGAALAEKFIEAGIIVTAVGRREDRLEAFVAKHGPKLAKSVKFDMTEKEKIPQFAADVMKASPDIDSVYLNSGRQGIYDFSKPESIDLVKFHAEVDLNFSSYVALTHAFIPYLKARDVPTSLIFTGTNIAQVPAFAFPAYSASKTALNVFILCIREQLRESGIKVIEISPPAVQTEIHDYMGERGRQLGMPIDDFSQQAIKGLTDGKEEIFIGAVGSQQDYDELLRRKKEAFQLMCGLLRSHF